MTNIPLKAGQTRWKYREVRLATPHTDSLSNFGAYGWELVAAIKEGSEPVITFYFKRPEGTPESAYKEIAEAATTILGTAVLDAIERCAHAADEWAKDHNVVPQGVLGDRIREAGRRLPP